MPVTGQVVKKIARKLKRSETEEKWFLTASPETLKRFRLLLELAPVFDYSELDSFYPLLYVDEDPRYGYLNPRFDGTGADRETLWKVFQNEIELKFGRFDNDSCSTLATVDDNPGTGRIIDKFFYQPIGQSIERLLLNLELKYFHPPEKSAGRIKRFLEGSTLFGPCVPVYKICEYDFADFEGFGINIVKDCFSLFMKIGREEKIAKAFQILLTQAR